MTPEKYVQNQILDYLKKLKKDNQPIFFERRNASGVNYKTGIPDIYVVWKDKHIEVEVKSATGKLSIMQEKFRSNCYRIGTPYICPHSFEEFQKEFKKLILN